MTGIERLRELADAEMANGYASLSRILSDIADQIEREHACDGDTAENIRLIVGGVIDDMERHCLGHEGMDDSPVARWARELHEALGGDECDHADEREAIAWVRKHGGLDSVKEEWHSRVPYDRHEKTRQRLLDHIAECETALGRRNRRIKELGRTVEFFQLNNSNFRHLLADVAERLGFTRYGDDYEPEDLLDALDRRLMPEGMEWPRFEDGEQVRIGDKFECWCGEEHVVGSVSFRGSCAVLNMSHAHTFVVGNGPETVHGRRVKRPTPKVLDADGVEIRVGDTVWTLKDARELEVTGLYPEQDSCPVKVKEHKNGAYIFSGVEPSDLTHQRHVLDADGNRIEPAMDVWWVCEGDERGVHAEKLHVESIGEDGLVTCDPFNGGTWVELEPFELYVHKPVLGADGVPIHEGDTVWCMATNDELTDMNIVRKNWPTMRAKLTVKSIISDSHGDKWADFEETYLYVKTCYLTHTNPGPRRTCQDCRFWQKDPTARTMGVCWRNYAERDCEDSYEARTEDAPACEYFRERGE